MIIMNFMRCRGIVTAQKIQNVSNVTDLIEMGALNIKH